MQKIDYEILELCLKKGTISPKTIIHTLQKSDAYVRERIRYLLKQGLLIKVGRGLYNINEGEWIKIQRKRDLAIVLLHYLEKYDPYQRLNFISELASLGPWKNFQ